MSTKIISFDLYLKIVFNDIILVTCMNLLLVKFMVKIWHRLRWGAINLDGGRLVRHHRVLCLILTSATQPTWREYCIYWRDNKTYIFKTERYYMSRVQNEKVEQVQHARAVHVAPPHGLSGTPLQLGNACCLSI